LKRKNRSGNKSPDRRFARRQSRRPRRTETTPGSRVIRNPIQSGAGQEQIDEFNRGADAKQSGLIQMQKQTRELQIKLNEKNNTINQINVEVAKLETKLEDLNEEIGQEMSNDWRAADVIIEETLAVETVRDRISSLKNKLALVGGIDETVPQDSSEVKERFTFLWTSKRANLNDSIASLASSE
jgi:chromosome segregation ATPase